MSLEPGGRAKRRGGSGFSLPTFLCKYTEEYVGIPVNDESSKIQTKGAVKWQLRKLKFGISKSTNNLNANLIVV